MFNKIKKHVFFAVIVLLIVIPLLNMIKNQICGVIMIDAIDAGDISKLEKVLEIGNPDCVPGSTLIDRICDSYYKRTPLQLACYKGDMDMVKLLVKKGADVNYVQINAVYSPLISTIQGQSENDIEIAKFLIDEGADVNYRCNVERPVISWLVNSRIVSKNGLEILKCLVDAGADPKKINHLHEVVYWKHNDIIKYFIKECDYSVKGGAIIQQYCRGVNKFSIEIFELLIKNGADIYEIDEYGKCAIDYLNETTNGDAYWADVVKSIYIQFGDVSLSGDSLEQFGDVSLSVQFVD